MIDVLAFGEVLWDVIDGVPHLGGAPFNLAAHAAKCGLRAAIVSAVGRDDLGRRAVSEARRLGVATDFIVEHPTLPTGTVNVTLDARGVPSYEIASPALPDGPVVDTVGAGDAFSAAFLAAVLRGESLQAAAEAGNRLAGRVAARPGAIPEDLRP